MKKIFILFVILLQFKGQVNAQISSAPDLSEQGRLIEILTKNEDIAEVEAADSSNIVMLNFIGYQNLEKFNLHGVHDCSVFAIDKNDSIFNKHNNPKYYLSERDLVIDPLFDMKNYTIDRVGYKFQVYSYGEPTKIKDTLIIYNFISKEKWLQDGFLTSDYSRRALNITENSAREKLAEKLKKDSIVNDRLKEFKIKLFPSDSLYLFKVKYRVLYDQHFNNNETEKIFSEGFAISNARDHKNATKVPQSSNGNGNWVVDSVWFHKAIPMVDLVESDTLLTFIGIDKPYNVSYDRETAEVDKNFKSFSKYNSLDYWANKIDEKYFGKSTFSMSLVPSSSNNMLTMNITENVRHANPQFSPEVYKNVIPFFQKLTANTISFFGKEYDVRVDNVNFKFINYLNFKDYSNNNQSTYFVRHSKGAYGSSPKNTKRGVALQTLQTFQSLVGNINEKIENQKIIDQLTKKYGAKYVNEALNGNVVINMPEDLLPIPLKLWEIYSRSNFTNGFSLSLYSLLDRSKKLYIKVVNHKVVSVSVR
jgi:hypothetical protein